MKRLLYLTLLAALTAMPCAAQLYIAAPLVDDREVTPGSTYEGVVPITNPTDEPMQARLYLTDYRFDAGGSNWYDEPGTSDRSNAGWVAFGAPVVTIPANSTLDIPYQVQVPDDAALHGSYWCLLMIEGIPHDAAESTLGGTGDGPQFGVRRRIRYGIQIASHIRRTGEPQLEIPSAELLAVGDGSHVLQLKVENTGTRMGETQVYLDLFDTDGQALGRFEGSEARIYPDTSFRHQVRLEGIASGTYEALLVVDAGEDHTYGVQYTLEF